MSRQTLRRRTLGSLPMLALVAACAGREPPVNPAAPEKAQKPDTTTGWNRPRSDDREAERHDMVKRQIVTRRVTDAAVLDAMRQVPRHWFVPERMQSAAYRDSPLPIGEGQTISQPYIVALMTESLKLTRASKVLEIGTGSGYQAAVLAEITPHVYTIEIVEPLGKRTIEIFKTRGFDTIETRIGDGYAGWPEHAPFDAIIVTCAPESIPPALTEQLKVGGRLVIPVGREFGFQKLVLVTKDEKGKLTSTDLLPVRFVPMTGEAQKESKD